jgi:hypothetical protein
LVGISYLVSMGCRIFDAWLGAHVIGRGDLASTCASARPDLVVDVRQLRPAESIGMGDELIFPCFWAVVGDIWSTPIAPTCLVQSPLRPRRSLGPRALFRRKMGDAL